MKKIIKDAIRSVSEILGFPWSTPKQHPRTQSDYMFSPVITDDALTELYERNQVAHAIVEDVAFDALLPFHPVREPGEIIDKLDKEINNLYKSFILVPLSRALLFTRLYGSAELLIGYSDAKELSTKANKKSKIQYIQAIPKTWVKEIVMKKDKEGDILLPASPDYYILNVGSSNIRIDSSRIIHMVNKGVDEVSLSGRSVLYHVFDLLTILKSMDWGVGQAMWRNGGGMTAFIAPEGAEQEQIDAIDEVVSDINAKTTLTLIPGTKMESQKPAALDPEKYYSVLLQQISIGTRIPQSILAGAQKGTLTASEKDRRDYYELLDNIQKTLLSPTLYEIFKKFYESGQLSTLDFIIEWEKTSIKVLEEAKSEFYYAQAEVQRNIAKREEVLFKQEEIKLKSMKSKTLNYNKE